MSDNVKELIGSIFSVAIKIVLAIIVVLFVYKYAIIAYNYGYRVFTEPPVSVGEGRSITVSVGEDNSTLEIGEMLETKGLIRDSKLFFLQELASENHGKIKAGKYELSTNMTATEMIAIMAQAEEKLTTEEELLSNKDEISVNSEMESLDLEEANSLLEDTEDVSDDGE